MSSIVRIRWFCGNSSIKAPNKDVFPEPLLPTTRIVDFPSIKNDNRPAAKAVMVPLSISFNSVHGSEECLLRAIAMPSGLNGFPIAVALALYADRSVSSTGIASENGLPLSYLNLERRPSASSSPTLTFVTHFSFKSGSFKPPSLIYTLLSEGDASMYMS